MGITLVSQNKDCDYRFEDKQSLGEVVRFVASHRPARMNFGFYGHEEYGFRLSSLILYASRMRLTYPSDVRSSVRAFVEEKRKDPPTWTPPKSYTHGTVSPLSDRRRNQIEALKKQLG